MTDKKITELTALTSADLADVMPIVDVSAGETKKITVANLLSGGGGLQVIGPFTVSFTDPVTSGVSFGPALPAGTIVMQINAVITVPWTFSGGVPGDPALVVYFTNATAFNLAAFDAQMFAGAPESPFGATVRAGVADSPAGGGGYASNFAALTVADQLNLFIDIGAGTATAGSLDMYALVQYL